MTFLIDDLLIGPWIWLLRTLRDLAYREMYDPEKISDQIKENRMLYEFGEVTKEEYDETTSVLMHKLKLARRVEDMGYKIRTDILGGG